MAKNYDGPLYAPWSAVVKGRGFDPIERRKYEFGGLERSSPNIARLISELEGSYHLLKCLGFKEDMDLIQSIKGKYYKLYFGAVKSEKHD